MKTKRILALLVALIMVFQLMPVAFAEDSGDDGRLNDETVTEPAETPAEDPAEDPTEDPVLEPVDDPIDDPFNETAETQTFSEETIAVFFTDALNWDGSSVINVHYWNTESTTTWPGVGMKYLFDNSYRQSVYYAKIPADVTCVIFNQGNNNQGNQTVNIETGVVDGAWWYTNGELDNGKAKVSPLGNVFHDAKSATCTEAGNTAYYLLDEHYYDTDLTSTTQEATVIPAAGHTLTHTEGKAATCTENGNIEYWYCSICNKYFSDADCSTETTLADTIIPASGHQYEDGVCTVCGAVDPDATVAKIGDTPYATLQGAIDAAHEMTGDVTVMLLADVQEVVVIHQKAGLNLTVTGENQPTITGQIHIDGDGRSSGTDTVTIIGLKFAYDAATYEGGFVNLPDTKTAGKAYTTGKYNYAHNITVSDCEFSGVYGTTTAFNFASIGGGIKNITLKNLTADAMHSLAQMTGVDNVSIEGCKLTNAKNGVSLTSATGTVTVKDSEISVNETADGYTFRMKGSSSATASLSGNTFRGYEGLVLNTNSGKMIITDGYYAGQLTDTAGTYQISGGYFTVIPDLAYCAEGLYPIASGNADYPYTVGNAVAAVDGLGYATFAEAVTAAANGEKTIKLLVNIEEAYTLAVGETLKVEHDGKTLTVNAPAHYTVQTAEADRVTTYTLLGDPCTITFIDGYTGETLHTVSTRYGEPMPTFVPDPLPTREGYDLDVNNLWMPVPTETVTGSRVYSLNWIEQHTVTFDPDNGTAAWSVRVSHNGTVEKPEDPEKTGYTFLGWFDGNNEFDFTRQIHENIDLKAHWKINQYTVTFMDGETVLQKTTADYGTAITAPEVPAREGWIFKGWDVTVPATIPAGDLTIHTVWAEAVAKIGDVLYDSVAAAIDASVTGDTIEVFAGTHDIPATAVIPAGVTLNGAGNNQTTLKITTTNGDGLKLTNENITISDMTIDGSNITSGGYKSLVNVEADGCVIDNVIMTGGGTSTWNSSILVERLTAEQTFTVKNSVISGSFRGVLRESCSANIVIENCEIDAIYPLNIDGGNGGEVTVTGSKLHGWTSYSGVDKVTFKNCEFSKGNSGYDVVAAYVETHFEGCTFDADFDVYAQTSPFTFYFDDCEKAGTELTFTNFKELFPNDSDVWKKCDTYVNGHLVGAVAMIGEGGIGKEYKTVQAAVDAAHEMTGDVTVTLLADVTEVVLIHQKAGLNLTVDGDGKTVTGQFYVDGDGRYEGTDTLIIQNVKFAYDAATYDDAFIDVPSTKTADKPYTTGKYNYAHNITVSNCEFAGEGTTTVAFRVASGAGANKVTLSDLTVTGGHSFAQLVGVKDLTITGCNVTGVKNGINISGGEGTATISGNTLTANATEGYTVRVKDACGMAVTLTDNTFSGGEGIVNTATGGGTITVADGKYAGPLPTDGSKFTVQGGVFSVAPTLAVCEEGKYPILNTDPETMADYPYTVGDAVALVKNIGYPSVADAKAARDTIDDVITLLKNADYAFVAGDVLKIYKANDQIKFTYTVEEGQVLTISEPDANGVVTYTVRGAVARIEREGETLLFATIQEAVDAANENEVIEVIAAGTYTLPNLPKKVTIEGAVDNVVFSHTGTGNIANTGAGAAFKNVTFELGNNNYHGFQHNGGLTFEGCTFNGKLFTYGSETFKNCTFNQTNKDYHLWIYGGDNTVAFEGCTFTNTTTGKFLNVYNENGAPINLTINNCKFINEGSESKAAVNVKETCGTTPLNFNVTITGCTTEGAFPESSETAALVVGERGLWQVDDRLTNGAEPGVVVFLDDVQVYPVYKASVSDGTTTTKYTSLKNAITAANALSGEVTVTMLADDAVAVEGYALTINAGKNIILDLNGHDVVGACANSGTSALIRNLGTLTIQDSGENGKLIGGADPTWTWDGSDDYSGSYASNLIRNEGTLVVNSGYLYNASTGSAAYAIDNYSAGKVTINGGTVDAKKASAIRLFYNNGGEITVNGGTIGHYTNDNDCTYMGIQVMSGTNAVVNVNGGTIAGNYALYSNASGSSAVNITDGTFDGYVGFAASQNNIAISGGRFTEWVGTWGSQTGFITGGVFAVAPDFAYCGKDAEDNQLYPMMNDDPETKDAFPFTVGIPVAVINDSFGYATLEAAFAAAKDGDTIKVLKDSAGNGIQVPQGKFTTGLTVDFNGHSYEIDGSLVGSTGTETQAFQLLKDNRITFKNGTISSEKAYMLIQNYSSLTLENMTLDGSKLVGSAPYTLSNNNGTIVIDGSEIIAKDGGFAFDVCRYSSYTEVHVTVTGNSVINGNIEVSASNKDAKDGFSLMLESGTFTGAIVLDASVEDLLANAPEKAWIKKVDANVANDGIGIPKDYKWVEEGEGISRLTLKDYVAEITETGEKYESLAQAAAAAEAGQTIVMIADSTETERVRINVPVTLDLNGKVVTNNGDTLMNASADLTILDSSEEGTGALRSNTANGRAIQVIGGTTTLKSGELYGKQIGVLTSGANFVMDGGKVTGGDGLYVITGSITVNGGEVNVTGSALVGLNDSTVTVNGGTIHGNNTGLYLAGTAKGEINGGEISGLYGIGLYDTAEVVMNDGAVKATGYCVSANFHYDKGFTFTMKGGQLLQTDKDQPAIYMPGIGTVNIEGGYIEGKYAVKMMHGVLNISGGTLVGLSENAVEINSVCWGANDLRSDADRANYSQTPQVLISGGYFKSGEGYDAIEVNQGTNTHQATGETVVGGIVEDFMIGGYYTTVPKFEHCGVVNGVQYYPMMSGIEEYPYTVGDPVAVINDSFGYATLEAAFADAIDRDTIVVLRDSTGNGIKVPQGKFTTGLTVDFNGHSYEIDGSLVGSTGTETQAFQLLMDNNITFKNGTITSEKAKILVQNYSNLTLENMTLDGSKLIGSAPYTLSNNNGTIVINGSEIIAKDGGFAFDVCRYASYKSVNVTVKGDSVINGNIEVYASNKDAKDGFGLMLEDGTFTGAIVLDASVEDLLTNPPKKAWVKRDKTKVEIEIPAGYTWVDLEGNIQLLVKLMTVTFDADNGTEKVTVEVPKGQKVERPSDPVKDHYNFLGWFEEGAENAFDFETAITENVELKARWQGDAVMIIYTDYFTGRILQRFNVHYGDSKEAYTFTATDRITQRDGYHYNVNDMWTVPVADTATEDIVYVLKWIKGIAVTFDPDNGDEAEVVTVDRDTAVEKPATDPVKEGYTFAGWFDGNNAYDFTALVTGSLYLKAKWTPNKMTVTFDTNGGSAIEAVEVDYDTAVTMPEAPTKDGFVFNGWTLNGEAYDFGKPVTSDITLTAQWLDAVAKIGDVMYLKLKDAVDAVQNGETIVLLKDTTTVDAENGLTYTIAMNGHTLTGITWVTDNTTLTLDGSAEGSAYNGSVYVGYATNNNGNVILDGGTYTCGAGNTVLHINGTCLNSNVTIRNAKVISPDDNGIQLNGFGEFLIENSEISGATGVYVKSGHLTITNSTITGSMSPANYTYNGNGAVATGDAIVIDSCEYPGGAPVVEIGDGNTFNGTKKQVGYYEFDANRDGETQEGRVTAKTNTLTVPDGYAWLKLADNEYLLVKAVAQVEDGYYATFEEAFAVEGVVGGEKIIKLLADGAEYEFHAGDVLKVQKANNDITFVYTSEEGVIVKVGDADENGVVTYTTSTAVARISSTYYATVAEAIAAAEAGDTIEVLQDVAENPVIEGGKSFTLDLGGHTLTGFVDQYDADVTVKNGTIAGTIYANGLAAGQNGKLTIEADATVKADYAIILYQASDNTGNGFTIDINGTVEGIVWVMGNIKEGSSVINVNDGATITGDDVGIALNGAAIVNVKDGATVTGTSTGIEVRAGELNVTGGTISGNGAATEVAANGSGTTTSGAGIAIAQHTTELGITVNISGGTINGKTALNIANPQGNDEGTIAVAVTGGIFNGPVNVDESETRVEKFVSGGDFIETVKPEYVVDGKLCTTTLTESIDSKDYYYIVDSIKVTFNADNGSENTTVEVPKGEKVSKPEPDPTKEGYKFLGWFDGNNEYNFSKRIYEELNLKAHWEENEYETSYVWSDDNSSVVATATCTNNSANEIVEEVSTTSEITREATCTKAGERTYTAVFQDSVFETQTKTEEIAPLGHDWDEPTYVWASDNSSVTATRICKRDVAHVEMETAAATSKINTAATCDEAGEMTFTAQFANEAFETQTKTEEIAPLGHDWDEPTYTWSDDNSTVTAASVCKNNEEHVETETASATLATLTAATCEEAGEGIRIAEFSKDMFETQTKRVAIPALGHDYGEPVYQWAEDRSTVTAAMVCANDSTHKITVTVSTTYEEITPATEDEDGYGRYTAEFEEPFETQTLEVIIPAVGHEDVTVTFDADGGTPAPEAQTIPYAGYAQKPADPEKEGYIFDGWYLGEELFDFAVQQITENTALKAKWTEGAARIGTTLYATLAEAFAAAKQSDTIVLLKDVGIASITVDKQVTLNLNGHEVRSDEPELFAITAAGDFTITGNGKITGPENGAGFDGKTLITVDGGKLAIENGTLTATGSGSDGMYGVYVRNGGTAIFGTADGNGPTIESHFAAIGTNNTTAPATITVYGGTYTAKAVPAADDWWSYFCAPIYAVSNGSFTIKGGTFNGYYGISSRYANVEQAVMLENVVMSASSGIQVFVDEKLGSESSSNRTIKATTNTLTIPDGYAWKKLAENEYLLVKAVAQVDDSYFATFEEAFAAEGVVGGEKVIKLLADGAEYEFHAGDVLKVQKANNDITFVYTSEEGVIVKVGDADENGVVTYTTSTAVARISSTYYATVAEAIAAAEAGDTIEVLQDVAENPVIEGGKSFTLDLDGHTLTGFVDQYDADVTVKNGTIAGTIYTNGLADGKTGKLTIAADATIKADFGIVLYQAADNTGNGFTIDINGTVEGIVWVMGNIKEGNSVINVNNGGMITGDDVGIAVNGAATVNVKEGATVTGTSTGIEVRAGELNVTGGTISGNGAATEVAANGSGTTTSGAGIAIAQHTTELGITVNISGGTINGKTALNIANPQGNDEGTIAVAVTGGIFNGPVNVDESETRVEKFVSGGDFIETVKPEYVVDGKLCTTTLTESIDSKDYYYIVDSIKVTFNANEGTFPASEGEEALTVIEVMVPAGETVAAVESPVRENYSFEGWFEEDAEEAFDFANTPITANLTLKAKWKAGEYIVTVTSSGDGTPNPGMTVAHVTGGGKFALGEKTVVSAPAVTGYTFLGWYEVNGEKLSSEMAFEYTVRAEKNDLIAVYQPVDGAKFRLTITASRFTINDGTVQRSRFDDYYTAGGTVTLKYVGSDKFLYWVNDAKKIVSTSEEYTFTLVADTIIDAVYSESSASNEALVLFVSSKNLGQVISQRYYTNEEAIVFPAAPTAMGKTFVRWDKTEEEIHALMATDTRIVVYPIYESVGNEYTVTIEYWVDGEMKKAEQKDPKTVGTDLVIAVDGSYEGKTFSYWTDDDGNILGYKAGNYVVRPTTDITLRAVYGVECEPKPVVRMTDAFASRNGDKNVMNFMATRNIPEGYTLEKAGVLYAGLNRVSVSEAKDKLTLSFYDGEGHGYILDGPFVATSLDDAARLYFNTSNVDRQFIARAYIVVKDAGGEIHYIYSNNVIYASYSELNNNVFHSVNITE